jgi:predicted nucleic acid-binding protein
MAAEVVALDSSCLVALLCDWHEHHEITARAYRCLLDQKKRIVIPVHALLECYSVLTRVPPPYRVSTEDARRLIEENFRGRALAETHPRSIWDLLENLARRGLGGGQVYDALIAASAVGAGATVLLTWNLRHFIGLASEHIAVCEPSL